MAAAAVAAGLVGCSQQPSGDTTSDTLNVWIRPGLFSPKTLDGLKKQFPDSDIKVLETPDVEPKLRAALRAKSGIPDIVMLGGNVPDYYATEDSFVDLRDYGWKGVSSDYVDWKVGLGTSTTGRVIAVPLDTGPYVFFYRADALAALGYPTDPAAVGEQVSTWEGYTELAQKVAESGKFACDDPSSVLTLSNNQSGFAYFEKKGKKVTPTVDSPVLKENFLRAGHFAVDNLCAKVVSGTPEWNASAAQGSLVAFSGPIYNQNGLKTSVKDSVGQWRITSTPGGPASAKGSFLAVTSTAKNPSLASKVAYWLSDPENQTLTYSDIGSYPSTPASLDSAPFKSADPFYGDQVLVDTLQPILEKSPKVVVGPFGDNVSAVFKDAVTTLAVNGGDPKAAYAKAVSDAKSALGN